VNLLINRILKSAQEVIDYSIKATDGDIGHVSDFIVDDVQWAIRHIVVDSRTWWPGKKSFGCAAVDCACGIGETPTSI